MKKHLLLIGFSFSSVFAADVKSQDSLQSAIGIQQATITVLCYKNAEHMLENDICNFTTVNKVQGMTYEQLRQKLVYQNTANGYLYRLSEKRSARGQGFLRYKSNDLVLESEDINYKLVFILDSIGAPRRYMIEL